MPYTYQFNRTHADNTLRLRFTTPKGSPVTLEVDRSALASASKVVAALQDCQQSEGAVVTIPGEYSQQVVDHFLCLVHSEGYQAAFEVEVPLGWLAFTFQDFINCGGDLSADDAPLCEGFLENHYWDLARLTDYMDACDGLTTAVDRLWAGHGSDPDLDFEGDDIDDDSWSIFGEEERYPPDYAHPGRWLGRASSLSQRYPVTFDAACAACIRLPSPRWLEVLYDEEMRQIDREVLVSILTGREIALRYGMRRGDMDHFAEDERIQRNLRTLPRAVSTSPVREVFVTAMRGRSTEEDDWPFFWEVEFPMTTALLTTRAGAGEDFQSKVCVHAQGRIYQVGQLINVRGGFYIPNRWVFTLTSVIQLKSGEPERVINIFPVKQGGEGFAARVNVTWKSGTVTSTEVTPPHLPPVTQEECDPATAAQYQPSRGVDFYPVASEASDCWHCDLTLPPSSADTPANVHAVVKFELDFAGL